MRTIITAGLLLWAAAVHAEGYRVIVNKANPISSLGRAEVAAMLMKKTVKWSDGTAVQPVDQIASSPVRAKLTTEVHRKTAEAVKSYWRQQIFSGRETPPVEKPTDEDVLAYVRSNRGAIGYVADTARTDDVKVIAVQ